jgi:hypothetical protein
MNVKEYAVIVLLVVMVVGLICSVRLYGDIRERDGWNQCVASESQPER